MFLYESHSLQYLSYKGFRSRYKREFGFTIADRKIIVDDVRVRGVGKTEVDLDRLIPEANGPAEVEAVRNTCRDYAQLE